jgi:ribose transport system substrate-binding protein
MRSMRRWGTRLILAGLTIAVLGATGCQYHSKQDTYYLISTNLKLPYWKTVSEGFSKAAAEYGVTARIDGPDTYDAQAELAAFQKAVLNKPAGILISVADAALLRPEINSDAPTSSRLYFIGTNNLEAGHLGGQRLLEKLHEKGNVVFFTIAGQPNLVERLAGYTDMLETHSGIKIVDVFDTKGDAGAAFDQTEQYLSKTGADKIDAFVSLESSAGKGIAEVLKRKNVTDRTVIAMDVDADTLNLIKEGALEATVSQKPFTMGYVGLKALDEVHHNHAKAFRSNYAVDSFSKYPFFVDTGTALVDKINADLYMASAAEAGQP